MTSRGAPTWTPTLYLEPPPLHVATDQGREDTAATRFHLVALKPLLDREAHSLVPGLRGADPGRVLPTPDTLAGWGV